MEPEKIDIRKLSLKQLEDQIKAIGEPAFRSKQIYEWLWTKAAYSFDDMTNVSKALREKLQQHFSINTINIDLQQKSYDGTIKFRFKLWDGNMIEGVLIPSAKRMTACVSSQVGCSLSCKFCATGYLERQRNLDASEIFDQVVSINKAALDIYKKPLSNIVFMGMGEPLLNYANVIESINKITQAAPLGLGMSPQRITVSTAGISKMIKKMADDGVKINLALSLHSANNKRRSELMPINDNNNLESLVEALNYFYEKTNNRITLEYCVINDTNDHQHEAIELIDFARKITCKVNLIEYNPISFADYVSSDQEKIEKFAEILDRHKVIVNIRRSRGKDIDAACGQLAGKNEN